MAIKRLKLIRYFYRTYPRTLIFLFLASSVLWAQPSLNFDEEEKFYENFALTSFSKETVREELLSYYDLFGEHITDGFYIYGLTNDRNFITTLNVDDSTVTAASNEFRKRSFYEDFNNLVVTRDAVGGVKMAFLLGSQIRTRFSPLTYSKQYYEGIRWFWMGKTGYGQNATIMLGPILKISGRACVCLTVPDGKNTCFPSQLTLSMWIKKATHGYSRKKMTERDRTFFIMRTGNGTKLIVPELP